MAFGFLLSFIKGCKFTCCHWLLEGLLFLEFTSAKLAVGPFLRAAISNGTTGLVNWRCHKNWFYEDLQGLLELTPKTAVLFIIGDWNTKVGCQEIPGVTGKFGLGV